MAWAVVFTKNEEQNKREYLEVFTYDKEKAISLANELNTKATDKHYNAMLCETF